MSTAAVSVSPAENSAASSATCRRWTAATPFSAHYALTACPLRFAHAMILYHRSSQTASALFSMEVIFSGCMYFLECSPNTCSDSVFLFSHVYVSLARPWFRWALTIQAQKTLSCCLVIINLMEQRRTELLSKLFSHMKKTAGAGLTKTGCLLRLFSASISNVFLYSGQNEPYVSSSGLGITFKASFVVSHVIPA